MLLKFSNNINPVFEVFTVREPINDLCIIAFCVLFVFIAIWSTIEYYKRNKDKFGASLFFTIVLVLQVINLSLYITSTANKRNEEINNMSLNTVFSGYHVTKINKTTKHEQKKQPVLYEVHLSQNEKNGTKNKDLNNTVVLKSSVVIKVVKVNENGFDIIIPNKGSATIKVSEAKEVFEALNKTIKRERGN